MPLHARATGASDEVQTAHQEEMPRSKCQSCTTLLCPCVNYCIVLGYVECVYGIRHTDYSNANYPFV